jgi:hypothetical protein
MSLKYEPASEPQSLRRQHQGGSWQDRAKVELLLYEKHAGAFHPAARGAPGPEPQYCFSVPRNACSARNVAYDLAWISGAFIPRQTVGGPKQFPKRLYRRYAKVNSLSLSGN